MRQLKEEKEKLLTKDHQKPSCSNHYVREKEQAAAPVLQELVTIHKEETEPPPPPPARDDHLDRDEQISIDSAPF